MAAITLACGGMVLYIGYSLGADELTGDPVEWVMTSQLNAALFAGAVAGVGGGIVAVMRRSLRRILMISWLACAAVFTLGWAWGKASGWGAPPVSDLPLVLVASLIFSSAPAIGLCASIYGFAWLFRDGGGRSSATGVRAPMPQISAMKAKV